MKLICVLMTLFATTACGAGNTSDTREDIGTARVKQLVLSDAEGQSVVVVSARRSANGKPTLVVSEPTGAVLRTIDLSSAE